MRIVLCGSLSIDQIMTFNGLYEELIQPEKLHVLSIAPLVQSLRRTPGGIAGNIAYSLALLGEKPVLYSAIGQESQSYMTDLAQMGVDTSLVHYSQIPTATFSVLTDKNDCQVGGFYPGAMSDSSSLTMKRFQDENVLVVISAHDPKQMVVQAKECQKYGIRMVFDIGQQVLALSGDEILIGLEAAEVLMVNDYEMGMIVKKTGLNEDEIRKKVKVCVETLGEKGSVMYSVKNEYKAEKIQATLVKKPIDPTGAGDAFRAGFLYGYVRSWSLRKSAQLGSVAAAFVVEAHGTQEHSFSWKTIQDRYERQYAEKIKP